MGFWDDVGQFGEGLVGMGDGGTANDIGKGLGFLTPLGGFGGIGGGISAVGGAMSGDASAFGGSASGLGAMGQMGGLAQALAGNGSGAAAGGQPQFYQGQQAPGFLTPQAQGTQGLNEGASAAQNALMAQLQAQAQGKGPSLAQAMLQQGTDQNLRQQSALAAGGRNPGMASYQAMQNQGAAGQQLAGQSAQARMMEQLQAQQGLAGLTAQMQGQGLQNAGMQNQFSLANAQMGQQGNEFFNNMMAGQYGSQQNAGYQQQLQQMQNDADIKKAMIGGAFNAAGSALPLAAKLSDERAKKDIQPAARPIREMLDALAAHDYEYKNPKQDGAAPGRHVSVMAQELEKSALGRAMVEERNGVKMVDYGRGLGTMLAALADMNSRVKKVEKKGASDGR